MLNYKIVRAGLEVLVEKPVEITGEGSFKATNINIFIGLHRIRSVSRLLKSARKSLKNP